MQSLRQIKSCLLTKNCAFLTWMCICGGGEGVSGMKSSSCGTVGLCGRLTSRRPNLTIPDICVILTWWGFGTPFRLCERLRLKEEEEEEVAAGQERIWTFAQHSIKMRPNRTFLYLCWLFLGCFDFSLKFPLRSTPAVSSFSSVVFPQHRLPASRQPRTPPPGPAPLCCCWRRRRRG